MTDEKATIEQIDPGPKGANRPREDYMCFECGERFYLRNMDGAIVDRCLLSECELMETDDNGQVLGFVDPAHCTGFAPPQGIFLVDSFMFREWLKQVRRKDMLIGIQNSTGIDKVLLLQAAYFKCVKNIKENTPKLPPGARLLKSNFVDRLIREGKFEV